MEEYVPRIIAFCCQYCAYAAADLAGIMRLKYSPSIRIVLVPCTGRVDVIHLLRAIEDGADGVYVAGCLEGGCHFVEGNFKAKKRVNYVREILEEIGIEPDRVQMFNVSASDAPEFVRVAELMTERIRQLGPNPIKGKKAVEYKGGSP